MDPILAEIIKYLATFLSSTFVARFMNRKIKKEVVVLREQNESQQDNLDKLQTGMIILQGQLIHYQNELIELKDKSNEDESTKKALRERVAELEALCERQERELVVHRNEITKLKEQLGQTANRVTELEVTPPNDK